MLDHDEVTFKGENGIYNRGNIAEVPSDHLVDSINFLPLGEELSPRDGFDRDLNLTSNVLRVRPFLTSTFRRYFVLKTGGNLYDSIDLATPILTIAAMTDFAVQVINDRAYILPNNGFTGLSATSMYVYDRALAVTARIAAGAAPTTQVTPAAGAAGNNEIGTHIIAYSYETNTGFVTAPGGHNSIVLTGHVIINLTTVANGPAGTVKKWIWMSRAQKNWNGDLTKVELFLVGTINDNVTTTFAVNVFDTQLITSADKYLNRLATVPAGVAMCVFQGRLVTVGEVAANYVARISYPGEPEAFSSLDGFNEVFKGDYLPLQNCVEDNGILYIFRPDITYSGFDNGKPPSSWKFNKITYGLGTGPEGIGLVFDDKGKIEGHFLVVTRAGITRFNGTYEAVPLTWKIDSIWQALDPALILKGSTSLSIDPINKRFWFCAANNVPSVTTFVGEFSKGLNPQSVRWYSQDIEPSIFPKGLFIVFNYLTLYSSVIVWNAGAIYNSERFKFGDFGVNFETSVAYPVMQSELASTVHISALASRAVTCRNDIGTDEMWLEIQVYNEKNTLKDTLQLKASDSSVLDIDGAGTKWNIDYKEFINGPESVNLRLILTTLAKTAAGAPNGAKSGARINQVSAFVTRMQDAQPK